MSKEYQSEKSPIFDSQKSPKAQRKLHIMSQLYASEVYQMFCNTRYNYMCSLYTLRIKCPHKTGYEMKDMCLDAKMNIIGIYLV